MGGPKTTMKYGNRATYIKTLTELLDKNLLPYQFNKEYSSRLLTTFLQSLDPYKDIFLQEDMERLKVFQYHLDKELDIGTFMFVYEAKFLYFKRLGEALKILQSTVSPFEYNKVDTYAVYNAPQVYALNNEEKKQRILKRLQLVTVNKMAELASATMGEIPASLENKARSAATAELVRNFSQRINWSSDDALYERYVNSLIQCIDPFALCRMSLFPQ